MKLTPLERRLRICELANADEDYQKLMADYLPARDWFEKHIDRLPRRLRERLWAFPGCGHFIHHRMLNLICENMKFIDED